jgi:hypothetical protein
MPPDVTGFHVVENRHKRLIKNGFQGPGELNSPTKNRDEPKN